VAEELDAVRAWLEQNAPPGAAPFSPSAQPAVANVMDAVAL
jgi:hypothetical protein